MKHIKILNDVMAVYNQHYVSYGDYSVTTLIDPPRLVTLHKRYRKQVVPDWRYQIGSFIGVAGHKYVEECLRIKYKGEEGIQLERTLAHPFTVDDKIRIVSGMFDILYTGDTIDMIDNKFVNVWAKIFDPEMKKWHEQQNMYAYLLHLKGTDVDTINIAAWYKDWIEGNALRDRNYPQDQVQEYELTLWPWEATHEMLMDRLTTLVKCEDMADEELPACTREERWERFPGGEQVQYAVMKNPKSKRALRVFKSIEEAREYIRTAKSLGSDSFVEVRYATRKRCERYCSIRDYCDHYVEYAKRKRTGNLNDIIPIDEVR